MLGERQEALSAGSSMEPPARQQNVRNYSVSEQNASMQNASIQNTSTSLETSASIHSAPQVLTQTASIQNASASIATSRDVLHLSNSQNSETPTNVTSRGGIETTTGIHRYYLAMAAGATAGVSEHVCMFPFDTIKTRLQTQEVGGTYRNVSDAFRKIIRYEGVGGLYRGLSAILTGAIPSHAVYFATYEACKHQLGANRVGYHPLETGIAGSCATMAHDAVVTPMDVVKQRMQMRNSQFRSFIPCMRHVYRLEGIRVFFRSYPTTVVMNVPFMAVHFITYETIKKMLTNHGEQDLTNARTLIAGGCAGATGGFVSTPFDVAKTYIQTTPGNRRISPVSLIRLLHREEGIRGLFKGCMARVYVFAPAAAICWTVYESMKKFLGFEIPPEYEDSLD